MAASSPQPSQTSRPSFGLFGGAASSRTAGPSEAKAGTGRKDKTEKRRDRHKLGHADVTEEAALRDRVEQLEEENARLWRLLQAEKDARGKAETQFASVRARSSGGQKRTRGHPGLKKSSKDVEGN